MKWRKATQNVGGHQDGTQHLGWGLNPTESTIWIDSSILPLSGSRYTINPDKQVNFLIIYLSPYFHSKQWMLIFVYTLFADNDSSSHTE